MSPSRKRRATGSSRPPTAPRAGRTDAAANVIEPSHETLAALQDWLASSAALPLASGDRPADPSARPRNAAVMLLSDSPALEDFAAGQPIGGEAWELAERMLAAIGIAADEAYSASLSCFHSPGARMTRGRPRRLRRNRPPAYRPCQPQAPAAARRRPGAGACSASRSPQARGHVHKIEGVRAVATFHPRQLIKHPQTNPWHGRICCC